MSKHEKIYQNGRKRLVCAMEDGGFCGFCHREKQGAPIDFGKKEQSLAAAKVLGSFHLHAENAYNQQMVLPQKNPLRYLQRVEAMDIAAVSPLSVKRGECAFLLLTDTLEQLSRKMQEKGEIRYGAVGKRGFVSKEGKVFLHNQKKIAEDLAIFDVWCLLKESLKFSREKSKDTERILGAYEEERPLSHGERRSLYGLLLLPYHEEEKHDKDRDLKEEKAWYAWLFEKERAEQ